MNNKKMMLISAIFLVTVLLIGCSGAAAPGPTPTPEPHPGQALVNERCTTCHDLSRTESTRLSKEGWQGVIDKMVMSGAALNADEEAQVVDYLSITYTNK